MTGTFITYVAAIALALLIGWAIPALTMRRLLPVLEASGHLVTNYRGRRIPTGLGLVWIVWAAGVTLTTTFLTYTGTLSGTPITAIYAMPVVLVLGAFAFGFVDDVYGSGDAKGFRGHLRAMSEGRLTTGGLKLLGIGVLALAAGAGSAASRPTEPVSLVGWACAALVIALAANLVNLMDLRPGRAIKAYGLLAVVGVVITTVGYLTTLSDAGDLFSIGFGAIGDAKALGLCIAILLLGPVAAIWRFDLGERAMLGDAGANAMGALAGYFLVMTSPLWLLVALAVILLALNLASERFSFSKVIERFAFLRWIDGLGRLPAESLDVVSGQECSDGERAGGSAAADDEARKDGGTSNR